MDSLRFPKSEKLTHKALWEAAFLKGKTVKAYPLRLSFLPAEMPPGVRCQAGFAVPKRKFRNATDRNRIKRIMREAYRKENPGEELTLRQASELMGVSQDQLALVLERSVHMSSLDVAATTRDGDGSALIDLIASEEPDEDDHTYASQVEQIDAINSALAFISDEEAEESFKAISEAYSVLSDREKRARYDQFGHAGVDGGARRG